FCQVPPHYERRQTWNLPCWYHSPMRRIFVISMVLMLPLRGWTVEDMTVKMAGMEVLAASISSLDAAAHTAMPSDCPMMAKAGTDHPNSKNTVSCQACQLCMAIA